MKKISNILIVVGLMVVVFSPYVPDVFYQVINSDYSIYDYRYSDIRLAEVISSFRMAGVILSVWGLILKVKEKT